MQVLIKLFVLITSLYNWLDLAHQRTGPVVPVLSLLHAGAAGGSFGFGQRDIEWQGVDSVGVFHR